MVTHINGFSNSGIDIDDTVAKLMKAARMPQDKLKQQKQTLEWQRDDYRTINSKIMSFRDLAFNMKLQSQYQTKKATSMDENSVSVTGSSVATQGNYTIKVDQLATSGAVTSGALSATTKGSATPLSDLGLTGTTTLTVGGSKGTKTIEIKPTDTLGSVISAINNGASTTGVNLSYDSTIDKLFFTSSSTGSAGKVNISMGSVGAIPDPLATVFKIAGGAAGATTGSTVTGTNNFAGSLLIDGSLDKVIKTVRVHFGATTADFTIDKSTTYDQLIKNINSSAIGTAGVTASLDSNNNLAFSDNTVTLSDANNNAANVPSQLNTPAPNLAVPLTTYIDKNLTTTKTLRVKVGATTTDISIDKTMTIGRLIDSINSSEIGKLGVSAYLDSNHHLAFNNPDDDPAKSVTLTDETNNAANVIPQLAMGAPVTGNIYTQVTQSGSQAKIEFNGAIAFYDTNSFSVNGLSVTAKKVTATAIDVNVTGDTEAIYTNIKNFVDKYNELIDLVNTKTTEKRYRDFTPLTDDQRKDMKEDQITAWETKAKSGMLRSDDILKQALQNLRTSFSNPVSGLPSGDAKSLADIGISTSVVSGGFISGSYLDNGKIYIDDTKLKKAIAEKPDQVMALFVTDDKLKDSTSGDGIATRLNNLASSIITKITTKAGVSASVDTSYTLGKTTKGLDKRIDDWTTKLDALQTRYYTQFTAMEKYINQLQTQSAQLTQQMG